MVRFKMLVLLVLIAMTALVAQQKNAAPYEKGVIVDGNGDLVQWHRWAGRAPADYVPETASAKDAPKALVKLNNIPGYNWAYGCTATATAMQAGYYDSYGAPNIYTGPMNGGVAPMTNTSWNSQSSQQDTDMNAIAASKMGVDGRVTRGHGDDYWIAYNESEGNDPYFGNWTEHDYYVGQPCTADFMGTNQWNNWGNIDGGTSIFNYLAPSGRKIYDMADQNNGDGTFSRDGGHGLKLFYEATGLEVIEVFNQLVDGYDDPDDNPDGGPVVDGYTFADYKRNIDQGRPVLIHIIGHSMLGYGYDEAYTPPRVYCRNTWSTATTDLVYFSWGGVYSNMQHYSMTDITLHPKEYYSVPQDVRAVNNNRTVTVTWWDSSVGGTRPVSYQVFRGGVQIATVATNSFQQTLASSFDGVHYYSVKAVYSTITTGFSDEAGVYVCASVTSLSDTFEDGQNGWSTTTQGQWLFNPATGWWGRDTQYKYAGTYSLSESPGANYKPNSDQLATGGAIAEVAPGLNFSTAADANCTFYLRYLIEESFDYLHFQSTTDGINWVTMKTWSDENSTAWNLETISLGHYAGESNVRFRFIFVSDPGYETVGSNIDNFAITPSATDSSFPYVFYTKDTDYYTEFTDGFFIESKIGDFSGVDYADVKYRVNGGAIQTKAYDTKVVDMFTWKLPQQQYGDIVEFWFEARDTASPANTGTKGNYFYAEGLHQKYDYSTVSFYTEIVTTTAQYDQKSYAARFSSFHDDIMGVVVRGYDDASQPTDNENMLINVWADNNGLPGATLITPLSFNNPATLQETNKWGYVDLSGYTALQDMVGDYFVGFECGNILGTASTVTRTTMTATGEAGEFDFGRAYIQSYAVAGGSLTWSKAIGYNHHIRVVSTDFQISPPIIVPFEPVVKSVNENSTGSEVVYVGNDGDFGLNYNASIAFSGFAGPGSNVHTNNFQSGLVYTNSGAGNWATGTGGAWNGTTTCAVSGTNSTSVMTSAAFNTASTPAGTTISLDFDYTFTLRAGASGTVAYWTGSAWSNVWTVNSTGNGHVQVNLPVKATNTQLRFTGVMTKSAGQNSDFRVDNIVVAHSDVPYTWLTLDGGTTTSGSVVSEGTDPMTLGFNTAGLTLGNTYTATVNITDADGYVQSKSSTVSLTVENTGGPVIPAVPANVVTSISGTNLVVNWDVSADATGYDVYASNDPYGTFTFAASVGTNQYTVPADQAKMFYHIKATNATKAVPRRTIKDIKKLEEGSGN